MIFFIELVFIGVMLNSTKVKPSYNGEDFLLAAKAVRDLDLVIPE